MPISNLRIYGDKPETPPLLTQMAQANDEGLKINLESIHHRKKLYESILEIDEKSIGEE